MAMTGYEKLSVTQHVTFHTVQFIQYTIHLALIWTLSVSSSYEAIAFMVP